jgi:hypothetical protein
MVTLFFCILSVFAQAGGRDLCRRGEVLIAGCRLAEKQSRLISFCLMKEGGDITYRMGAIGKLEMEASFSKDKPLMRWVDQATYTTYFGFKVSGYRYSFGIPQQVYGARAFVNITKNDIYLDAKDCTDNSFGEEHVKSIAMREVADERVRGNRFIFPPQ